MNNQTIAIFDFDGTITKGDTFLPFLYYSFGGWKTFCGIIYTSPFILAYFFNLVSNQFAKTKIIRFFLKNKEVCLMDKYAQKFINGKLNDYLRANIIERLKWHQDQNHITVLITASLDIYIEPWAKKTNFTYVESTELQKKNNKFTGDINGNNCYGIEKIHRLQKIFKDGLNNYKTYGYGDSAGDKFFIEKCEFQFFKKDIPNL